MTDASHPDVMIVGGGAIGLSLAWELTNRGASTAVVDRRETGREASWAAAGMIPTGPDRTRWHLAAPHEQLAGLSQRLHPQWHHQLLECTGVDNQFMRTGAIHLAHTSQEVVALDAELSRAQHLGIDAKRLAPEELAQLEPLLAHDVSTVRAADLYAEEAQVRSPLYLKALEQACKRAGVAIYDHCPASGWQRTNHRILRIETNKGVLSAGQFCVTTGCWSSGLLEPLGIGLKTVPVRGQIALVEGPPSLLGRHICSGRRYLVPRRDGRIVIGSTEEQVGFDSTTTAEAIDELRRFASQLAPKLATLPLTHAWAGLRPATTDGLPKLGRCVPFENLWMAFGHYRGGIQLAPATAVAMADLITGVPSRLDLSPFAPPSPT